MFAPDTRVAIATLILTSAPLLACARPARLPADLIVTDAAVWTGNPAQPAAAAVAVIGDRIVDVGSADEIDRWRGAGTTVMNAEGRRLIPGFNDAHVRMFDGGSDLENVDLRDAGSAAELARRINERAKAKPGEWILGGHWDERRWTPAGLPSRTSIDDVTNSSPVFVVRYDGRMALANATALGRSGITERTPDPPGGSIVRDASGFPTGVLQGAAMEIVARTIPAVSLEQRQRALKRALELAESLGVTSVQDLGASREDVGVYADLVNRRELAVRVYAALLESDWYDQAKLGVHRAFGSPWLRIGAVRAPCEPGPIAEPMRTRLMAADHAGLQLSMLPSSGGRVTQALDVFDDILRANGGRDRRFRLDGWHIAPDDANRLASLDVVASPQPGSADAPARALLEQGVRLSLGSGWPSAPLNPMLALDALVTGGLSPAQALSAFTAGSAIAEFQESEKGTIARGRLADMAILSDDVLTIPPAQIKHARVLTTIAGGKIVHQRKP
jgi:predicted amidohydrolase YtcJ